MMDSPISPVKDGNCRLINIEDLFLVVKAYIEPATLLG